MHNLNQPSYPTRHSSDLLIATLMLVERRSGLIVILVMSILATGISVIHLTGKSGITGGATPETAGAFFFAWTLLARSEEHTSEFQSQTILVCRFLLE